MHTSTLDQDISRVAHIFEEERISVFVRTDALASDVCARVLSNAKILPTVLTSLSQTSTRDEVRVFLGDTLLDNEGTFSEFGIEDGARLSVQFERMRHVPTRMIFGSLPIEVGTRMHALPKACYIDLSSPLCTIGGMQIFHQAGT